MEFPVSKPPPKAHFWPIKDQKKRKRDLRDASTARKLLTLAPELDDEKYRPVILSFARVSNVTTDVYKFLRRNGLVGEDGEIRASVSTLTKLLNTQLKFAQALGLTPGAQSRMRGARPTDFAAALTYGDDEEEPEAAPAAEDGEE
jgi:hypothetical protein